MARRRTVGYVQNEWVCPNCQTRNKGGEKTCENCGAPQPENVQFQLPSEQKFVTDEKKIEAAQAGADIHCGFCGTRNPATAETCSQCGADLKEGKARESGRQMQAPPPPPKDGAATDTPTADAAPTTTTPPEGTPAEPAPAATTPDDYFGLITQNLQEGKGAAARAVANRFLAENPKSDRAPEALYRIAESYQNESAYADAATAFQVVIDKYATSTWAPWSMLRQGECFEAMGKKAEAKLFWEDVVRKYPKSKAAKEAKTHLGQ